VAPGRRVAAAAPSAAGLARRRWPDRLVPRVDRQREPVTSSVSGIRGGSRRPAAGGGVRH
jgi:hypothetical protein